MDFHFFWGTTSPLSQWHPCVFYIRGQRFNCTEQYMMYMKAMTFGEPGIAADILTIDNQDVLTIKDGKIVSFTKDWNLIPKSQKAMGRRVPNFIEGQWNAVSRTIVFEGNLAKFTQNQHLYEFLRGTGNKVLVESSPYDKIWGIGLGADDPRAKDPRQWQGMNWLGETLMDIRKVINEVKVL